MSVPSAGFSYTATQSLPGAKTSATWWRIMLLAIAPVAWLLSRQLP